MDDNGSKKPESALAYGIKSVIVIFVIVVVVVAAFVFGLAKIL